MTDEERSLFNKYIYLENTNVLSKLQIERRKLLLEIDLLNKEIAELRYFVSDKDQDIDERRKIETYGPAFIYEREHLSETRKNSYLIDIENKRTRLREYSKRLDEINSEIEISRDKIEKYKLGVLPVVSNVKEEVEPIKEVPENDEDLNRALPEDGNLVNIEDDEDKDKGLGVLPIPELPKDEEEDKDKGILPAPLPIEKEDKKDIGIAPLPVDNDKLLEVKNVAVPKKKIWKKVLLAVAGAGAFIAAMFGLRSCVCNCDCIKTKTAEETEQDDEILARLRAEAEAAKKKAEEDKKKQEEEKKPGGGNPGEGNPGGGNPGGGGDNTPSGPTPQDDQDIVIDEPVEDIPEPVKPEDEIISEEEITPEGETETTVVEEIAPEQETVTIVEEITPEGETITHTDEGDTTTETETIGGGETVTTVEEITPWGEVVDTQTTTDTTTTTQEDTSYTPSEDTTVVTEIIPTTEETVVTTEELPMYLDTGETGYNYDTGVEVTSSGDTYIHTEDSYVPAAPAQVESAGDYTVVTQEDFVPHEEVYVESLPPTGNEVTYDTYVETASAPEVASINEAIADFDWDAAFDAEFGDGMTLG